MSQASPALSLAADRTAARAIAEFQSDSAELLEARPPLAARVTLHVVAGLVASLIFLAIVLPIDKVVTSRGRITSVAPTIVVQPLETSIIKSLHVREGQVVKAGDVLATLDPTFSTADVSVVERKIASLEAEIGRFRAELAGELYKAKPQDLDSELQARIAASRAAQYNAVLTSFEQKIAATRTERSRAAQEIGFLKERLSLTSEVETMRTTLQSKQVGTRLSTIEASDARVEIERNIANQQGALDAAEHSLQDIEAQRDSFRQKWKSDIAAELVDRQRQLDQANEEFAKADKRRDLIDLRAVQDAVVLQVGDVSVGSVVQSAERIVTLIPIDGGLQVEIDVSARDQGYVKVGQPVELKLDAWRYTIHGSAKGTVRSISGDSFAMKTATGGTGPVVYRAMVDITDMKLRDVPADFRLVPGMPLTADVAVGSRTIMSYFLELAMPMMTEGMREP